MGQGTETFAFFDLPEALASAIQHGFALLIGVTVLLPPAAMLRAIVQEEAQRS